MVCCILDKENPRSVIRPVITSCSFTCFFQLSFNQLSFQGFGFRLLFVQTYLRVHNQIFERDYFHKGIRNRSGLFTVTTVTNTVFIGKQSTTAV